MFSDAPLIAMEMTTPNRKTRNRKWKVRLQEHCTNPNDESQVDHDYFGAPPIEPSAVKGLGETVKQGADSSSQGDGAPGSNMEGKPGRSPPDSAHASAGREGGRVGGNDEPYDPQFPWRRPGPLCRPGRDFRCGREYRREGTRNLFLARALGGLARGGGHGTAHDASSSALAGG